MFKSFKSQVFAAILLVLGILSIWVLKKHYTNKTIRVAINEWAGYAPFVYGLKAGIFEKHNVNLELILTSSFKDMHQLLIDAKIEAGTVVITDLVAVNAKGADLVGVFMTDESGEGDGFVASANITNFSDLKGATISYETKHSFSHLFVLKLLSDNGIDLKNVKLVDIPFDYVPNHIDDKIITAGHTWVPELSKSLAKGHTLLATGLDSKGMIVDFLAVQRSFLTQEPEAVENLKNAFYEAQEKMLSDQINTPEYFKEFYLHNHANVYGGLKKINYINKDKNNRILNGPEIKNYISAFEYIGKYFAENGFIKDKNEIFKMINLGADQVNP